MNKRKLSILVAAAVDLSLFAACNSGGSTGGSPGSGAGSDAGTSTAATGETTELDMFWFADGAETESMQGLIDTYEADNPHIKINMLEVPFEEMQNKIMMSVSGGESPALARTTDGIISFVHEATLDLWDYVDGEELLSQFMPSIHNQFVLNGKICAVPTDVTANGMIYNKTAFDNAGVSVPLTPEDIWTWDEFIEALRTVVDSGEVQYGMVIDNPTHRWATIMYEFGGRYLSPEGAAFNSPETLAAVNMTKGLFDEELVPKSTWLGGEDPNNMFRSGQVAVHLSGNWMLTNYRDNITDFEWGVCYLPMEKYRSSVPGGKQLAAFVDSGREQEAIDFILYATAQEPNAKYCEESLFLSPRLDNASLNYSFGSDYFAIFANELANTVDAASYDWGYPGYSGKVGTVLTEGMYEVISGDKTPEEYLAEVEQASNDFLNGEL